MWNMTSSLSRYYCYWYWCFHYNHQLCWNICKSHNPIERSCFSSMSPFCSYFKYLSPWQLTRPTKAESAVGTINFITTFLSINHDRTIWTTTAGIIWWVYVYLSPPQVFYIPMFQFPLDCIFCILLDHLTSHHLFHTLLTIQAPMRIITAM